MHGSDALHLTWQVSVAGHLDVNTEELVDREGDTFQIAKPMHGNIL